MLFCGVAVLVASVYLLIIEPATRQRVAARQQIERMSADIQTMETTAGLILSRAQIDPDQGLRERHDLLVQQLEDQRQQLHQGMSDLVAPAEMPELLKQLLRHQQNLHLLRLENLAPEIIGNDGQAITDQSPRLYRHRMQMELRGDYLSALAYLRQLEQLPRLLVWEEIAFAVEDYPLTTIRLRVYTLGLTEGWLGG